MDIGTEQVFIVNCNEVKPTTSSQRIFAMPVDAIKPEEPETTSICSLPQASMRPPSRMHMCRLCATNTEMVIPIFEGEGLQNSLADKIHQHLPIQVSPNDVLPVVVCFQCTSTLLAWHELVVCSVQADNVMRERFNLHYSETQQQQQQPNTQAIQSQNIDDKLKVLTKIIKNVLMDYFHTLNMDEKDSQVELVCQRCIAKSALTTEEFTEHLITEHRSEVTNEDAIQIFIRNHVTFEEALVSESEQNVESVATELSETPERRRPPTFLCPYCESAFSSTSRLIHHLNNHMAISIDDGIECCKVLYTTKNDFVAHLQEKHVNRLVHDPETTCKSCGFTADSAERLHAHVREHHGESERQKKKKKESSRNQKSIPAVCPECNKTFSHKYNMFFHMRSHKTSETHRCDKCGKEYSTRGNLAQHTRLAHDGVLRHVCGGCGERFPTRAARDLHARLHSGARPFRCDLCCSSFRAKNSLDRHRDAHLDVRRHRCRACARAFRKRSHLAAHARTHAAQ